MHAVPSRTLYVENGFAADQLPIGTTAVHLDYYDSTERVRIIPEEEVRASKITSHHVRSFELHQGDQPLTPGVSTNIKGAEWSRPGTRRGGSASSLRDIEFFGGHQLEDAESALAASRALEMLGIAAERVVRIDAPEVLAWKGELMEPNEVIDRLVSASEPRKQHSIRKLLRSPSRTPVTTMRTAATDLRVEDIGTAHPGYIHDYLQEGMDVLSVSDPRYSGLQATEPTDVTAYLAEALPTVHGRELGQLEASGYQQMYPHEGNIGVDGSIRDLDDVVPTRSSAFMLYSGAVVDGCLRAIFRSEDIGIVPKENPRTSESLVYAAFERGFQQGKRRM